MLGSIIGFSFFSSGFDAGAEEEEKTFRARFETAEAKPPGAAAVFFGGERGAPVRLYSSFEAP